MGQDTDSKWTLQSAVEQIESCGFTCEAGPLALNRAFMWLKSHLATGPKFHLDQQVRYTVSAEVNGVKVAQTLRFWVVAIFMSSDTERLTWTYSLSTDPPRPYHYGSGTQFSGVAESALAAIAQAEGDGQ